MWQYQKTISYSFFEDDILLSKNTDTGEDENEDDDDVEHDKARRAPICEWDLMMASTHRPKPLNTPSPTSDSLGLLGGQYQDIVVQVLVAAAVQVVQEPTYTE